MSNKEWDAPLDDEGREFKILPKAEYRFVVAQKPIVPVTSKGDKTKGAPMARLELIIYALDDVNFENPLAIGFDSLIRHTSTDFKVCQFFVAIGERKHKEIITPNWAMVPGATGLAIFFPDKYEGKESMKVERYLDPPSTEALAQAPAQAPAPAKEPDEDNLPF